MRLGALFLAILTPGSGFAADEAGKENLEPTWRDRLLAKLESLPPAEASWQVERYLHPLPGRLEAAKEWNRAASVTGDRKMRGQYEHAADSAYRRAGGLAVPITNQAVIGGPLKFRIEQVFYPSQPRQEFKETDWTDPTPSVFRYHGNSDQSLVVHDVVSRRARYVDPDERILGSVAGMPLYRIYHLLRSASGLKLDSEDSQRATAIGVGDEPIRHRAEGFIKFELIVEKRSLAPVELRVFRFSDTRPAIELKVIRSGDNPFFPAEVEETRFDSTFKITKRERWTLQDGYPKPLSDLNAQVAFVTDATLRIEDERSDQTLPLPAPVKTSSRFRPIRLSTGKED